MTLRPRVMLGKKSGITALEVSQPGKDVLTCAAHEMLFSSLEDVTGAIETGSVTVASGGTAVVAFDVGGAPLVSYQVVTSGVAVIPSMYPSFGFVWPTFTDTGMTFHNNSGASRVVNYQIWNKRLL